MNKFDIIRVINYDKFIVIFNKGVVKLKIVFNFTTLHYQLLQQLYNCTLSNALATLNFISLSDWAWVFSSATLFFIFAHMSSEVINNYDHTDNNFNLPIFHERFDFIKSVMNWFYCTIINDLPMGLSSQCLVGVLSTLIFFPVSRKILSTFKKS